MKDQLTQKAQDIAEALVSFLRGEGSQTAVQLTAIGATRSDRGEAWRLANLVVNGAMPTVADAAMWGPA